MEFSNFITLNELVTIDQFKENVFSTEIKDNNILTKESEEKCVEIYDLFSERISIKFHKTLYVPTGFIGKVFRITINFDTQHKIVSELMCSGHELEKGLIRYACYQIFREIRKIVSFKNY